MLNENELKICDFDKRGNVVRLYLTTLDDNDYWGDDWDDYPYEHNAGTVYGAAYYIDIAFNYDISVVEPADDWSYGGNSPFSKKDFKQGKAPCLVVNITDGYSSSYSQEIGNKKALRIYYNDRLTDILKRIKKFHGTVLLKHYKEDIDAKR